MADVTTFLQERCRTAVCTQCGQNQWNVRLPPPIPGYVIALPLDARKNGDKDTATLAVLPIAVLTCENCGFVRMHALEPFRKWLADRGETPDGNRAAK